MPFPFEEFRDRLTSENPGVLGDCWRTICLLVCRDDGEHTRLQVDREAVEELRWYCDQALNKPLPPGYAADISTMVHRIERHVVGDQRLPEDPTDPWLRQPTGLTATFLELLTKNAAVVELIKDGNMLRDMEPQTILSYRRPFQTLQVPFGQGIGPSQLERAAALFIIGRDDMIRELPYRKPKLNLSMPPVFDDSGVPSPHFGGTLSPDFHKVFVSVPCVASCTA